MIIDRLSYMLADMMQNPACTAEGGDSPTFSIQRYAQYGIIYLLGKKIPDEYKIYRGDPIPPAGGGLQPFLPSLILINAGLSDWGINLDFRKTNSQFGKESMVYGGETMTYKGETMSYD